MENLDRFLQDLRETEEGRQYLGLKRVELFRELHDLVFFGKGGYDFETVYHLPTWLRHFIKREVVAHYKREEEAVEKASSGQTPTPSTPPAKIRVPDFVVKPRK